MRKFFKYFFWVLAISLMVIIFCFSSQPAKESQQTSEGFTKKVFMLFSSFRNLSEENQEKVIESVQFIVRKTAHFSAYGALGLSLYSAFLLTFSQKLLVKKENAVLITHGGVIHVIRSILENRLYSNQTKQRKVQYAEVIALTYENGVWKERKDDAMALKELEQENLIAKAESFLKETFAASTYLRNTPKERDYRLEHSYRVANIAKTIAEAEGFDVTNAVIAGLLHDIAYCEEMVTREDWKNHGRRSAAIARPFLESLGLGENAVNEICYGIAIHVDDEADFRWERTPFCETVGDADNIDRFDAYRIYETLESLKFSEMKLEDKREKVEVTIGKLNRFKEMKLGTVTAKNLWLQRLDYYIDFYEKLKAQLDNSSLVSVEVRR